MKKLQIIAAAGLAALVGCSDDKAPESTAVSAINKPTQVIYGSQSGNSGGIPLKEILESYTGSQQGSPGGIPKDKYQK